jgi:hypothetical protein
VVPSFRPPNQNVVCTPHLPKRATCPARLIHLALITLTTPGEEYNPCSSSLCSFLQPPVTSSDHRTKTSFQQSFIFSANSASGRFPNHCLGALELNYTRLRRVVLYNLLCLLSLICTSILLADTISILRSFSTVTYYKRDTVHSAAHALHARNKEQPSSVMASNTTSTKNIKCFVFSMT